MDKPTLYKIITDHFDENELRTLYTVQLGLDYDSLQGEGKDAKARELIAYLERHGRISELIEVGKRLRPNVSWDECLTEQLPKEEKAPGQPPRVPFTNREDEIKLILSSYAPPYYLLDAPAGFGKTELLMALKRRFVEQEWVCAYTSVQEDESLDELVEKLVQELDLDAKSVRRRAKSLPLGLCLGGELVRKRQKDITRAGLVLLVDLEEKPSLSLVEKLLIQEDKESTGFIHNVQDNLRALTFFAQKHNRFRVIVAARCLAAKKEIIQASPPLKILQLSPFNYQVIQDSAREYLVGQDRSCVDQISAHLLYITGGHPGCMAKVLEMYRDGGLLHPDRFVHFFSQSIWEDIVRGIANDVFNGIPKELPGFQEMFEKLSVFRYLNYQILKSTIERGWISDVGDAQNLADKLTATYLLTWKGPLLRDEITRRLLAIRLWHEMPEEEFRKHCQQARTMCADYITTPNVRVPEMWVIEYLFQSLQQHATIIQDPEHRKRVRKEFFEKDVPCALRMFVEQREVPLMSKQEEKYALEQALQNDWEFQFTVNYYLREGQYGDAPYTELHKQIDRYF
jgi:hypothetical protein